MFPLDHLQILYSEGYINFTSSTCTCIYNNAIAITLHPLLVNRKFFFSLQSLHDSLF